MVCPALAFFASVRYNVGSNRMGKELFAVMETHFETINTKELSLPEQTAEQISKLIMEQHLTSEDKLPSEFELAELLNVGRGTVREGVKLLVADGRQRDHGPECDGRGCVRCYCVGGAGIWHLQH